MSNIIKNNFVRKSKNYVKKLQLPWEITSRFLKGKEERLDMGLFCQNLVIMAYNLENYSNFKSENPKSGNIFEIHYYFRSRGNARFNDLSQVINTLSLSRQDFAGLDNFNKLENLFCMQGLQRSLIGAVKIKNRKLKKKKICISINILVLFAQIYVPLLAM